MICQFFTWPASARWSGFAFLACFVQRRRHAPKATWLFAGALIPLFSAIRDSMQVSISSSLLFFDFIVSRSFFRGGSSLTKMNKVPLLPLVNLNVPSLFMKVISIQPFLSSFNSWNGTGYGIVNGRILK